MNASAILECGVFLLLVIGLAWPLGAYMARVYTGESKWADRVLGPVERLIYKLSGVKPDAQMNWKQYAGAVLVFNLLGLLAVYLLQRVQLWLPINPAGMANVPPEVAEAR